jgi:polysaccharide biosynthesis protein PelF
MIAGTLRPQLGGEPRLLDIVGVNYYRQNQWVLGGTAIDDCDRRYRPFRSLLGEVFSRYGRPVLVAETGTEGDERATWFETIMLEATAARRAGIPVEGICLYPIIDHVGWDNDRYCPSGLLANRFDGGERPAHRPLASAIGRLQERLAMAEPAPPMRTTSTAA